MNLNNNEVMLGDILVLKSDINENDIHYSLLDKYKKYLLVVGYGANNKAVLRTVNTRHNINLNLTISDIDSINDIKHYNIYRLDGSTDINILEFLALKLFDIDDEIDYFNLMRKCYNAFKNKEDSFTFENINYTYTFNDYDFFDLLRVYEYITAELEYINN